MEKMKELYERIAAAAHYELKFGVDIFYYENLEQMMFDLDVTPEQVIADSNVTDIVELEKPFIALVLIDEPFEFLTTTETAPALDFTKRVFEECMKGE